MPRFRSAFRVIHANGRVDNTVEEEPLLEDEDAMRWCRAQDATRDGLPAPVDPAGRLSPRPTPWPTEALAHRAGEGIRRADLADDEVRMLLAWLRKGMPWGLAARWLEAFTGPLDMELLEQRWRRALEQRAREPIRHRLPGDLP